ARRDFPRHCEEHLRRSNPFRRAKEEWIASRSLSSGGASRRPVGSTRATFAYSHAIPRNVVMPGLVPAFAKASPDWHRARRSLLTAEVRLRTKAVGVDGCRASTSLTASRQEERGWPGHRRAEAT